MSTMAASTSSATPQPGYSFTSDALYCPIWKLGRCRSTLPSAYYVDLAIAGCFALATAVSIYTLARLLRFRRSGRQAFGTTKSASQRAVRSPFIRAYEVPAALSVVIMAGNTASSLVSAYGSSAVTYRILVTTSTALTLSCVACFLSAMLLPVLPHVPQLHTYVRWTWVVFLPFAPLLAVCIAHAVYEDRTAESWTADGYADAAVVATASRLATVENLIFAVLNVGFACYILAVRAAFARAIRLGVAPRLFAMRRRQEDDELPAAHVSFIPPGAGSARSEYVNTYFPASSPGGYASSRPSRDVHDTGRTRATASVTSPTVAGPTASGPGAAKTANDAAAGSDHRSVLPVDSSGKRTARARSSFPPEKSPFPQPASAEGALQASPPLMPPAALSTSMSMSSSVLPDASSSSLDDLLTTLEEDIPIGSVGAMRACLSIVSSLFAANVVIAVLLVALQAAGPWGRASGGSDPAGSTVAAFLGFATQWISQVFILVGILGSEIILMMLIERAASR